MSTMSILRTVACLVTATFSITPLLAASSSPKADEISPEIASATFEKAWDMMRNSGALEEISETDWEAMYEKYQTPAYDARTNAEIRVVLNEMITSLGKSHFSLIPKESSVEFILGFEETEQDDAQDDAQDDEVSDQLVTSEGPGDGQIGIDVRLSDGAILVARVVDDSAASRAGVKSGWRVRKIRNFDLESQSERMKDIDPASMEGYQASGMAQALVSGAPGTAIPITFVDEDGQTHALRIACSPSQGEMVRFGNLPPMPVTTESMILDAATLDSMGFKAPDDIKIGVIRFNCWMVPIMEPIAKAVDEFRTQGVDAVILDLRGNPGGIGGLSMGVGGHFLEEPTNLGIMKNRFGEMNFNTNPQTITTSGELVTPLDMPLYIIIDSMSASTSEIFAGGMSEAGRATIVGRRSPGMALPAVAIDLPNGDVFYCATASFKLPSGKNVEGLGITPDIKIDLADNDATFKNDPDLSAVVRNHLAKIASPSKSNSGVQK